jgi:hypothetical protein
MESCQHRFTKLGFKITRVGRKQRYQCQLCGVTTYKPELQKDTE